MPPRETRFRHRNGREEEGFGRVSGGRTSAGNKLAVKWSLSPVEIGISAMTAARCLRGGGGGVKRGPGGGGEN